MLPSAAPSDLAGQARRLYTEQLVKALPGLVHRLTEAARSLLDKPAEHAAMHRRRELLAEMHANAAEWHKGMANGLRQVLLYGASATRPSDMPPPGSFASTMPLSLVDDETIEREILTSRLALAVMDRASWEFSDLRARIASLEKREELDAQDMLRSHVLARIVVQSWRAAGCQLSSWRELQNQVQFEFSHLVEEAYHETNSWLLKNGVLAEIDLRPFIKRTVDNGRTLPAALPGQGGGAVYTGFGSPTQMDSSMAKQGVQDETRLMTRPASMAQQSEHAEAVLGRLNRLLARHVPDYGEATQPAVLSPGLSNAIAQAQSGLQVRADEGENNQVDAAMRSVALLEELAQRKQALKQAATSPDERATIEIVALLFQSILTEERIPPAVRVWFARLQMPVLRVAVGEPDFFATLDHPARRLIDRMGSCVMGFDAATRGVTEALDKEIKRVVQVVEAYPDTGRRVFQTVLTEFEKFLENYFKNDNEATRKAVSLSQQVEQRETLAIQYTIELRRMLNEMPVQEGVRQFLFQTWADVLATTSVRFGVQSEQTKAMKKAASDLIWSAGAKVTREERAEVIRRLTPLLKTLREGMASAGMDGSKQNEQIQALNNSLAAAFTAKAAVIPHERLKELAERLESLEEMLPDAEVAIDDSIVLDLSGHDSGDLEVVDDGGSMPTPAMLKWARELQVGSWYMLDYKGQNEAVQLAWQGMRKHLSMFVTAQGRCMLFQQQRLASYLQAGLMLPAQEEALTVRATRDALAKLDVEPERLLN